VGQPLDIELQNLLAEAKKQKRVLIRVARQCPPPFSDQLQARQNARHCSRSDRKRELSCVHSKPLPRTREAVDGERVFRARVYLSGECRFDCGVAFSPTIKTSRVRLASRRFFFCLKRQDSRLRQSPAGGKLRAGLDSIPRSERQKNKKAPSSRLTHWNLSSTETALLLRN
jgi:hypothetical protein